MISTGVRLLLQHQEDFLISSRIGFALFRTVKCWYLMELIWFLRWILSPPYVTYVHMRRVQRKYWCFRKQQGIIFNNLPPKFFETLFPSRNEAWSSILLHANLVFTIPNFPMKDFQNVQSMIHQCPYHSVSPCLICSKRWFSSPLLFKIAIHHTWSRAWWFLFCSHLIGIGTLFSEEW